MIKYKVQKWSHVITHHSQSLAIIEAGNQTLSHSIFTTLESGIVVPVGIIVLVGTFARFNKRTGGNKCTGGHFNLQM